MKTYEMMMMEVMTMTDMNKIKGGTLDQRKIAQERQRSREKKNALSDPLAKSAPDVKAPPTPTKDSAKSDPLAKAAGLSNPSGLAKTTQKALPPAKGGSIDPSSDKGSAIVPSKKSQMGKWSQGIKQSPGKLAKKSPSNITPPSKVNKVRVTDDGSQGMRGNRPGSSKSSPTPAPVKPQQKKKPFKMPRMPNIPKPKLPNLNLDFGTKTDRDGKAVGGANLEKPQVGPADKAKP